MPKDERAMVEDLEMPMGEEEMPEAEGMDFADYSDEDLMMAAEEAEKRGLLTFEVAEEDLGEAEEGEMGDEEMMV